MSIFHCQKLLFSAFLVVVSVFPHVPRRFPKFNYEAHCPAKRWPVCWIVWRSLVCFAIHSVDIVPSGVACHPRLSCALVGPGKELAGWGCFSPQGRNPAIIAWLRLGSVHWLSMNRWSRFNMSFHVSLAPCSGHNHTSQHLPIQHCSVDSNHCPTPSA